MSSGGGVKGNTYGNDFLDKGHNLAQKKMIIFSHTTNGAETERSFKIFAAILICLEHRKKNQDSYYRIC